jgi:hypothetical protein
MFKFYENFELKISFLWVFLVIKLLLLKITLKIILTYEKYSESIKCIFQGSRAETIRARERSQIM